MEYRDLMKVPDKTIWERVFENYLGRLAQGVGSRMKDGNSTIFFVHPSKIPSHKKITYGQIAVDIRPFKAERYRVRLTVG